MLGSINKNLTKEVAHLKTVLLEKEQFSSMEIINMLASMESNLQESFKTIL